MERKDLKITQVEKNIGQVEGLPSNPRQWTGEELDRLKRSIKETPEMLEARSLIVYEYRKGKYITLGGNMRLDACKELGYQMVPCYIMPKETTVEKMKQIVIKDNGSFGDNDWDKLANEWSDCPLTEWGLPVWKAPEDEEEAETRTAESGKSECVCKLTFPNEEKKTQFVEAYKRTLEMDYQCTLS